MDTAQARLRLTSFFDGVDALTDELVGEAARLLAAAEEAQYVRAKIHPKSDTFPEATERVRQANAPWTAFMRQHGLTVPPGGKLFRDQEAEWRANRRSGQSVPSGPDQMKKRGAQDEQR